MEDYDLNGEWEKEEEEEIESQTCQQEDDEDLLVTTVVDQDDLGAVIRRLYDPKYMHLFDSATRVCAEAVKESIELKDKLKKQSDLHEDETCVVCQDKRRSHAFAPCGHFVCCKTCGDSLKICPICRCTIVSRLRIFTA